MAGFVRATRNGQFNESAQRLVQEGLNHYQSLRETLTRMTTQRGYNKYFESYTPVLNEESEDNTSLNELFVQEKLDPRIESVLPILNRLSKNITEMSEVKALEEWADSLTEVEDETTKTLAEPAEEMLDEAPGAETLAHNDSTEKSNLKAFDLDEGFSPSQEVADQIVDSIGGEEGLTIDDVYRAISEYQTMMDNPHKLDVDEVAEIVIGRLSIEEVDEGLDANQKRAGQLGPTEPVGKNEKNLRGKLVGASESIEAGEAITEMDSEGHKGSREDGDPYAKGSKATPSKSKDTAKDAEKALNKSMDKAHKKDVKEGQDDLVAILRIVKK